MFELFSGLVLLGLLGFSARWNWWRFPQEGIPVLMYHKIGFPPPGSAQPALWVTPGQFQRQLKYLQNKGYQGLTLRQLDAYRKDKKALPPRAIIISFDDGYQNNYTQAFPLLKQYGFPAVFFLVVETVGKSNLWHNPAAEEPLPMLSWSEIEEMHLSGLEFASHTLSHPRLNHLPFPEMVEEIHQSKQRLSERLGNPVLGFAYPYGDGAFSEAIQREVAKAGYHFAFSVRHRKANLKQDNPLALPRLYIRGDDSLFDFSLNLSRGRARL